MSSISWSGILSNSCCDKRFMSWKTLNNSFSQSALAWSIIHTTYWKTQLDHFCVLPPGCCSTLRGDKASMFTHAYPHQPQRKVKVTVFNHWTNSSLYMWSVVWSGDLLVERSMMSYVMLNVLPETRHHWATMSSNLVWITIWIITLGPNHNVMWLETQPL